MKTEQGPIVSIPEIYRATVRGVPDTIVVICQNNEHYGLTVDVVKNTRWHEPAVIEDKVRLIVIDPVRPHTAKMLVETLAVAQSYVGQSSSLRGREFIGHLQFLINQINPKPPRIAEPPWGEKVWATVAGLRCVWVHAGEDIQFRGTAWTDGFRHAAWHTLEDPSTDDTDD